MTYRSRTTMLRFEPGPYAASTGVYQYMLSVTQIKLDDFPTNPSVLAANVDGCTCARRQLEFLCGRICAERALRDLGVLNSNVRRAIDRAPVWPPGVVGSISHTHEFAAAAIGLSTKFQSLGVDSERVVTEEV